MTHATTLAKYAAQTMRRMATALRAILARYSASRISGRVQTADQSQKAAGGPQMPTLSQETIIHRRAVRVCNRRPDHVAAFVRIHTILSRER